MQVIVVYSCQHFSVASGEETGAASYNAADITEALNETTDSRADTTMDHEITQDSVAM